MLFTIGLVVATIYKKEIISTLSDQLKAALHTDVQIGDADVTFISEFPNITLRLEEVSVGRDSVTKLELFHAGKIDLNLRTYKLLFKKVEFRSVRIIDASVFVYRTAAGKSNLDMLVRDKADTVRRESPLEMAQQHVLIENTIIAYQDSLKNRAFNFTLVKTESRVHNFDSVIVSSIKGKVDFERLVFNPAKGSFLAGTKTSVDLHLRYLRDSSMLVIEPSALRLPESNVGLSGTVLFGESRQAKLRFTSTEIGFAEGLRVLPESLVSKLSVFEIARPFQVDVRVDAPLTPGVQPTVEMDFMLKDNRFTSSKLEITDLSLTGHMTNHHDPDRPIDNANSRVRLTNIEGKIDGLPMHAEASLIDFSDLRLELHAIHAVELVDLNKEVDSTSIRFTAGRFHSEFEYAGKLNEYLDVTTGKYSGELSGTAVIEKGAFTLVSRKLAFNKINSVIRFSEDSVWINNLDVSSGKSAIQVRGLITNYVPFFVQPQERGYVQLRITSPHLDIGSILVKKKKPAKTKKEATAEKKKVSDMLDKIFNNLRFDITLDIDQLKHRQFYATDITGLVRLKGTTLEANKIKMKFGGGEMILSATMKDLHKAVNPMEVTAKTTGVRIKDLFLSCNNFNQKTITDKNVYGSVSLNAKIRAKINDDFSILMPTLTGQVDVSIRDGRLVNVEALHKMSTFLFKRRDYDDVKFAEIKGDFEVANRDLDIGRMEIQSTVISLFLEGKYSLDTRTDLTIQVPLNNLKKRDRNYVPQNVGTDTKVGPSVFLRAQTNEKGETDISYDPFNRWRKRKGK